jgi:O-antigen/teichoic acid export membrane protein
MSTAATCTIASGESPYAARRAISSVVVRYGLSAVGPLCISAAHFVAAVVFLRAFSRAEFGLFSFVLVVVPFSLSLSGAMIGAPLAIAARRSQMHRGERATYLKANLVFGTAATFCVFALMRSSRADWALAAVFGAYGGVMTLRWFARTLCYATGPALRVLASDLVYSLVLLAGLLVLHGAHALTALRAADVLLAASAIALVSFGRSYLREQFRPSDEGSLGGYRPIWFELARWSALGVALTELTANAHAYLVTFIAGPAAFAPLAVGTLLVRPVQLVLAAVPDRERPVMARQLSSGDHAGARRSVNHFRMAAGAVWLATILVSGALLLWFPHLVLKKGYDPSQSLVVLAFFAAITAARTLRTPESVLLQAAGEFRALAHASLWSCTVSLAATLLLLLVAGPVYSLAGILAGELVVTARILLLSRRWMRRHA